jgi:hypothetical protein
MICWSRVALRRTALVESSYLVPTNIGLGLLVMGQRSFAPKARETHGEAAQGGAFLRIWNLGMRHCDAGASRDETRSLDSSLFYFSKRSRLSRVCGDCQPYTALRAGTVGTYPAFAPRRRHVSGLDITWHEAGSKVPSLRSAFDSVDSWDNPGPGKPFGTLQISTLPSSVLVVPDHCHPPNGLIRPGIREARSGDDGLGKGGKGCV